MTSTKYSTAFSLFIACVAAGCSPDPQAQSAKASPSEKPATVENGVKEPELATLRLTPEAETKTGIEVVAVERRPMSSYRTLSGEVTIPPGQLKTVTAPVAGTVMTAGAGLQAGTGLQRGQVLYRLLPLDRESGGRDLRAEAEKELRNAQAHLEAAQLKFRRADQLLRDGAGSQRNVEESKLELSQAEASEKAARDQLAFLSRNPFDKPDGLPIESPDDGIVLKSYAGAGQVVSGGSALVDIARVSPIWIRVPVYVGEARQLSAAGAVIVHGIGGTSGNGGRSARRVSGVPTANPSAATVDLYYEIENPSMAFRQGERVGVSFASGRAETLVLPWSAVIHDINGGTWVYENTAPQTYSRRRVEVMSVTNGMAALRRGPAPGTKVVKTGAAELFAAEFGVGK